MHFTIGETAIPIAMERIDGDIEEALERYREGEQVAFDVDIDLSDYSPFQQSVLEALMEIPYGETRTYQEIAERIGNPGASRAVAQACGMNPVPVVIPCHRVVASDGLGGYSLGEDVKRALLELEGVQVEDN